jgi:hypothetical protein
MGRQYIWTLYMPDGTAYDNGKADNRMTALAAAHRSLREDHVRATVEVMA